MTLIIGFKCSDGLVVGADSGATMGDYVSGLRTIMQPVTKLQLITDKAIVGVSGPVGLGQLYVDCVNRIHNQFRTRDVSEISRMLRDEFRKDAEVALHMAGMATQVLGRQAQVGAIATTLVALAARDGLHLVQFDCECCPEVTTSDLPFVSIGSGQIIADPFLAFLKRIFWKDRLPSVSDGTLAVVWTLEHAIDTAPGGIALPITIGVLQMEGAQPKARLLSNDELQEHREMRSLAEAHIKKFEQEQRPIGGESEPPKPHSS
jgi:20S proteasome alpha/beta subunit